MKVFFLTPAAKVEFALRRYASATDERSKCARGPFSYHTATLKVGDLDEQLRSGADQYERLSRDVVTVADDDARWPTHCEQCGVAFAEDDAKVVDTPRLYAGSPDGNLYTLRSAPVGAMWDAWWMRRGGYSRTGPDGLFLIVRTPGGDWSVDDRASNCTMRDDNEHRCWVRHGDPKTGTVHVDKNGNTCGAGAGSILCGGYHGFLHNGELTQC